MSTRTRAEKIRSVVSSRDDIHLRAGNAASGSTSFTSRTPPPDMDTLASPNDQSPYKLVKSLGGFHHDTINFLSFSPCGRYLVSGGDDNYMAIFDCSDPRRCEVTMRVKANSPPSAACWDPTTPISAFVGYGNGGIVRHRIGDKEEGWVPGVLMQNGCDRVVSLAWDAALAVATQSNVYIVDLAASKLTASGFFLSLNPPQAASPTGCISRSHTTVHHLTA